MKRRCLKTLAMALSFSMILSSASPIYATEADFVYETEADFSQTEIPFNYEETEDVENVEVSPVDEEIIPTSEPEIEESYIEKPEVNEVTDFSEPNITVSGNEAEDEFIPTPEPTIEPTKEVEQEEEIPMETVSGDTAPTPTPTPTEAPYEPVKVDAFSKVSTLKGVQGNTEAGDHFFYNCIINSGFASDADAKKNRKTGTAWEYEGKTYYFNNPLNLGLIRYCNERDITVNVEFLLQYDQSKVRLIDPESRDGGGHAYYAPNMITPEVKKEYEAFFDYLAYKCSMESCHIDNWILGNEVNMGNSSIGYHYTGGSKDKWVSKYASYFKVVRSAVRKYTDVTRISICVDHSWNDSDQGRGISTKSYLNSFAKLVGKNDWCISYHAYPAVLFETKLWEISAYAGQKLNPNNASARFVDGGNLNVMTNYVKNTFGSSHRIMLTEQGFSTYQGANNQAAAFVITYYAAKFSGMVDCVILHTANEDNGKLNFTPGALMTKCYNKIDSGKASDVSWIDKKILKIIGMKDWKQIIPNYNASVLKANPKEISKFVDRLYVNIYGRNATEAEIQKAVTQFKTGKTNAYKYAKKIICSKTAKKKLKSRDAYVKAAYKALTGSNISSKERKKYVSMLKKGKSKESVLKEMALSKKFAKVCKKAGMDVGVSAK